ncbi:DUF1826 domain-containing protein [Streptomyces sp. NPDC001076]
MADPGVCAVVLSPGDSAQWTAELADLVTAERLVIPRTTLTAVSLEEFTRWARAAAAGTPPAVAGPLVADMTGIVARVMDVAGTGRVMVRVFTEAPTRRCGFHVDTVPAQAPLVGALRVYNGSTTEYVEPEDVLGMTAFYAYLARRERLSRSTASGGAGLDELVGMDESPGFLRPGAVTHRVPCDATVYFRHLDVRRHWSAHPVTDTWIHRSPMHGQPRLVLNVSPTQGVCARPRSWASSTWVNTGSPPSSERSR